MRATGYITKLLLHHINIDLIEYQNYIISKKVSSSKLLRKLIKIIRDGENLINFVRE